MVLKIAGVEFSSPGDFMDFTKTSEGKKFVQNPNFCKSEQNTYSTVFVQTGYGWFWIDFKYESYADSFFADKALAFKDLITFRNSN